MVKELTAADEEVQDNLTIALDVWETEQGNLSFYPEPTLARLCEIFESASNDYLMNNPDPMDNNHPVKIMPHCNFGHLLQIIFHNESFLNKLVISYLLARDNLNRNTLAARLLLTLIPGVPAEMLSDDDDSVIKQLFQWAQHSESRELRAYSFGLLGAAMDTEKAQEQRANNQTLIPTALQHLRTLHAAMTSEYAKQDGQDSPSTRATGPTNFASAVALEVASGRKSEKPENGISSSEHKATPRVPKVTSESVTTDKLAIRLASQFQGQTPWDSDDFDSSCQKAFDSEVDETVTRKRRRSESYMAIREMENAKCKEAIAQMAKNFKQIHDVLEAKRPRLNNIADDRGVPDPIVPPRKRIASPPTVFNTSPVKRVTFTSPPPLMDTCQLNSGFSNTSWKNTMLPIVVGSAYRLYPLSIEMEQRLILQYLAPICEYQDSLSLVLENRGMDVVQSYLASGGCRDVRLLFDALTFTSSLLKHRKFAWEFIAAHGVEKLLQVNRFSVSSAAVATCLTYLAYNVDIMEKVCQLPDCILNQLVDYALWLLDHSYEHGRDLAAIFFANALQFRAILDRFDRSDGLRRLYNYVAALAILHKTNDEIENDPSSDDLWAQSSMTIKSSISAFRTYLSSHMYLKIEHMKRSQATRHTITSSGVYPVPGAIPTGGHAHSKAMILDVEAERECVNYLLETQCLLLPHHHNWRPIDEMRNLGVFRLMLVLLSKRRRTESVKLVLEVLHLATVSPKIQLDMCETMVIKNLPTQGIACLLELAEGVWKDDLPSYVQRMAVEVLINCACGPGLREGGRGLYYKISSIKSNVLPESALSQLNTPSDPQMPSTSAHKPKTESMERVFLDPLDILQVIWSCAQQNNAIMILTNLLHTKDPPTDADVLREVACRALNGVVRHEPVRQILSKLPLIAANDLNALMQEPILLEKRQEHSKFCEQARILIELVTQTKIVKDFPKDMTQEKLWKAAVVAETRIVYNEKELLQLMYQHLVDIGFKQTAGQLVQEANLPSIPASRVPPTPTSLPGFPRQNESSFANTKAFTTPLRPSATKFVAPASPAMRRSVSMMGSANKVSVNNTPKSEGISKSMTALQNGLTQSPRRLHMRLSSSSLNVNNSPSLFPSINSANTPLINLTSNAPFSLQVKPHKALGEIVTEYFRKQHSACRNPVATCPPFSLFFPHRCPEPKLMYSAPTNLVKRAMCRSTPPYRCTTEMLRQADRRLVFSRFRYCKTFEEEDETFTCCNFSNDDEYIQLGNFTGDVFCFNVRTGQHISTTNCHHSFMTSIQQSKDGALMLTSSGLMPPLSMLWKMGDAHEPREQLIEFPEETYMDFGHNRSAHHLIGTLRSRATIYDTETGHAIVRLYDETLSNGYERNRACFDPNDELVLNDGILYDPRVGSSGRVVHKFDKLNTDISGCFHPKGSEVIINSEIWDLRTYRLLHTVPALNQCKVMFNSTANIIFGVVHLPQDDLDEFNPHFNTVYNSSFRTIDAGNYQVITTMDTKKHLHDFCPDHSDNYVAMIEANPTFRDPSLCKVYEIGRGRELDEEEEDEDLDDEDDDDEGRDEQNDEDLLAYGSNSSDSDDSESSSEDHYSSEEEDEEDEANMNLGEVEQEEEVGSNVEEEDDDEEEEEDEEDVDVEEDDEGSDDEDEEEEVNDESDV